MEMVEHSKHKDQKIEINKNKNKHNNLKIQEIGKLRIHFKIRTYTRAVR